jgi:segregation and condensation protein B
MVKGSIAPVIESLLFSSDEPLTAQKLKDIIAQESVKEIKTAISRLNQHYERTGSSLMIREVAGGYQMVTREVYAFYINKLYKGRSAQRLTQRALETLAIIAYKQPITKQEIEAIRGVNVDGVLRTLLQRKLITIEGRQKTPGNPLLYGTSKFFLQYFGLKSIESLPKLKEIDELLKDDDKFLESLDRVALEKLVPESLGLKNPDELARKQTELKISQENDKVNSDNKIHTSHDKTQ